MIKNNKEGGGLAFVSFILFPTDISENTSISIEEGSGLLFLNIKQGDELVRLDLDETFELKRILKGLKKLPTKSSTKLDKLNERQSK